jgi:hypothetical protein
MDALAKIKYYSVVLLIFIFPIGMLSRVDLGNAIALTLNDLVVAVIALLVGLTVLRKKEVKGELFKPIFIFASILIISLLIGIPKLNPTQSLVSASYIVRWIAYSSIYFIIIELGSQEKRNLLKYLVVSGLVTVIFGLFQFFLYPNLRNLFYAGWDEHLYRIFTGFLDPNYSGLIFTLLFILFLLKVPKTKIFENPKLRSLVLLTIFVSIVLTFSRTAILAFTITLISYAFMKKRRKEFYLIVLAIISITSFYMLVPKKESTNVFRTASTMARVENYKQGAAIFLKNPIAGVGFNSYRYALERYGFKDKMKYGPSHGASGNDNSFLFVLATSGIVGFTAFAYLLYRAIKISGNNHLLRKLSLFSIILGSFFVNALFFVFILEWLWIVLASTENT